MDNSVSFSTTDNRIAGIAGVGIATIDLRVVMEAARDEADVSGPYHSMISQAYSLQAKVEVATKEIVAAQLAIVEAEHEKARSAARVAMDNHYAHKNRELDFKNAEQRASDAHTSAVKLLNAIKSAEPRPALFPTKAEIKEWKDSVASAQKAVEEKRKQIEHAAQASQLYYAELEQLATAFNAASKREGELRKRLTTLKGTPDNTQNTGLAAA